MMTAILSGALLGLIAGQIVVQNWIGGAFGAAVFAWAAMLIHCAVS